ncbi:MAG: hypothetical protein JWP42_689 [Pseudomonas sp.]|nr:hypothetical protein [Pseudomonas sp.]
MVKPTDARFPLVTPLPPPEVIGPLFDKSGGEGGVDNGGDGWLEGSTNHSKDMSLTNNGGFVLDNKLYLDANSGKISR